MYYIFNFIWTQKIYLSYIDCLAAVRQMEHHQEQSKKGSHADRDVENEKT